MPFILQVDSIKSYCQDLWSGFDLPLVVYHSAATNALEVVRVSCSLFTCLDGIVDTIVVLQKLNFSRSVFCS